jgi:hypothetical protein
MAPWSGAGADGAWAAAQTVTTTRNLCWTISWGQKPFSTLPDGRSKELGLPHPNQGQHRPQSRAE